MSITYAVFEQNQLSSGVANEALSAGTFVDLAGSIAGARKFSISDTTDRVYGIVTDDADSGAACQVATYGEGKMVVLGNSANIAAGDRLKPDAASTGKGIKTTTDADQYGAIALEPATADDVIIRVSIVQYGAVSL